MPTQRSRNTALWALTVYITFVFVQSLFFKFTDSPETQYIFGTLDGWAGGLGFPGLFAPHGIFSQYVVGTAELIASCTLLVGAIAKKPVLQGAAALLSLGVISGAIFFHLFTPLGVQVRNADGTAGWRRTLCTGLRRVGIVCRDRFFAAHAPAQLASGASSAGQCVSF